MKKHISKENTQTLLLNVVVLIKNVVKVASLYLYDIKCLNRCDATLPYSCYTPLLLLQLLCNHVAVVITFF